MKIMKQDVKIQKLVIEVMKHVRQQTYTPEQLCERQRILDAQYFYYWSMDMKKEEYVCDLFTEDFTYRCFTESPTEPKDQAMRSKYVNRNMMTMHMSHNPLIWLIDETHARGIFLYEDNNSYKDHTVEGFSMYCNDFRKCEDGVWRISKMRIGYRKMNGALDDYDVPKDWEPKKWEEWNCHMEVSDNVLEFS